MGVERAARTPESGDYDQHWKDFLGNPQRDLSAIVRVFRRLPAAPRCKSCGVPFAGPYRSLLQLFGFRPWPLNEQLCSPCYRGLSRKKRGAEIPVSLLFTDVRGSTSLAEQMSPGEFRTMLDRFFGIVFDAVDSDRRVIATTR